MRSITVTLRDPDALRAALDQEDTTQADLARRAYVSPQRLCQLLNGHAPRVAIEAAVAIETALNVPRGSLFHIEKRDADLIAQYMTAPTPAPMRGEAA
ncbi:helix-turn-helix transcriptional regulator [Saccharopolyspora shandongensis]|uniref:helix-turn-helix domain-containing protein n=1 Tax=Saccharopolyspora shandongensis TaxID=418495 RepID=UPI003413D8E3